MWRHVAINDCLCFCPSVATFALNLLTPLPEVHVAVAAAPWRHNILNSCSWTLTAAKRDLFTPSRRVEQGRGWMLFAPGERETADLQQHSPSLIQTSPTEVFVSRPHYDFVNSLATSLVIISDFQTGFLKIYEWIWKILSNSFERKKLGLLNCDISRISVIKKVKEFLSWLEWRQYFVDAFCDTSGGPHAPLTHASRVRTCCARDSDVSERHSRRHWKAPLSACVAGARSPWRRISVSVVTSVWRRGCCDVICCVHCIPSYISSLQQLETVVFCHSVKTTTNALINTSNL